MSCRCSAYPRARERDAGPAPVVGELYERAEGIAAEATLADTEALVFTFSGRPDSIVVTARSFGARVRLTDELGRESAPFTVLAGESIETHLRARKVYAANLVAGSNALLSVHGKWAARRDPE